MTSYYAEIKKGVSKRKVTQNISGSYFSTSCNYVIENLISKNLIQFDSIAEILTSNSVGTQLSFLGCNQDNIGGSNFITKKKICLFLPEKEISNHRN